jgi:hypothetical protein
MARRILLAVLGGYLIAAVITRGAEALGVHHRCSCPTRMLVQPARAHSGPLGVPVPPRIKVSHHWMGVCVLNDDWPR